MKRLIVLIVGLSSLSACQSTSSSGCPPLINYSADQMKRAAAEMRALHKEAELRRMITHYGQLRDACRVQ
jgi:hypothetical protein